MKVFFFDSFKDTDLHIDFSKQIPCYLSRRISFLNLLYLVGKDGTI